MPLPLIPLAIAAAAEFAPRVVKWIGGDNAGEVAQTVTDTMLSVTGADDADSALAAMRQNPDLAHQFNLALVAQETELERIFAQDRQNARQRDVQLREAGYRNTRADILAVASIAGLIGLLFVLLFVPVPDGPARDVLLLLSGALIAIVKDVYGFEFGSSRGSKEKDLRRD